MKSSTVENTAHAVALSAASNIFAQMVTAYSKKAWQMSQDSVWAHTDCSQMPLQIDVIALVRFMILNMLTTPPNDLFGNYLEQSYPTRPSNGTDETHGLSLTNIAIQFMLQQSIGSWGNTIAFIVIMGLLRGEGFQLIMQSVRNDTWTMVQAGWTLWPAVCLLNLFVVPLEWRMLVGKLAAFGWGVFMSLTT